MGGLIELAERVECDMLVMSDGTRWGPFTSHWAATAAMIRLSDPTFASLGGDKPIDLAIEADIRPPLSRSLDKGGRS
jgi:hypothetical protein